jgi:hypothetical protein
MIICMHIQRSPNKYFLFIHEEKFGLHLGGLGIRVMKAIFFLIRAYRLCIWTEDFFLGRGMEKVAYLEFSVLGREINKMQDEMKIGMR